MAQNRFLMAPKELLMAFVRFSALVKWAELMNGVKKSYYRLFVSSYADRDRQTDSAVGHYASVQLSTALNPG